VSKLCGPRDHANPVNSTAVVIKVFIIDWFITKQ